MTFLQVKKTQGLLPINQDMNNRPDLMDDPLVVEVHGRLGLVWLDAANVERLLGRQGLHQRVHRVLEDGSGRQRSLRRLRDVVSTLGPHGPGKTRICLVKVWPRLPSYIYIS